MAYSNMDKYDAEVTSEIAGHCREILRLLGEDPDRDIGFSCKFRKLLLFAVTNFQKPLYMIYFLYLCRPKKQQDGHILRF